MRLEHGPQLPLQVRGYRHKDSSGCRDIQSKLNRTQNKTLSNDLLTVTET